MSRQRAFGGGHRLRGRGLASVLASPADVWLVVRMAVWSVVMPVLQRTIPLPRLTRMLWLRQKAIGRHDLDDARIALLARKVLGSADGRCMTRSLVLYRVLSGYRPGVELVVAMRRHAPGLRGHAWVLVDGKPFAEAPGRLEEFTPVVVFGPRGVRRTARGSPGPRS